MSFDVYRQGSGISLVVRERWDGGLEVEVSDRGMGGDWRTITVALDRFQARDLLLALVPRELPIGPAEA